MALSVGAKLQLEPGSWLEAIFHILIGILVGANHNVTFFCQWMSINVVTPILTAFGFEQDTSATSEANDKEKTLKVVAVGYGRTGTYSLALALEELGYPTLHTQHLYEHREIFTMWTDDVFQPAIEANQTLMGHPDLKLIAESFQATADLPMALYFEQVMEEFPDCKFILTTRENSEVWFRSWDTLTKSIVQPTRVGVNFLSNVKQLDRYLRWLFSYVNKDVSYLSVPYPLPDQNKEASIAGYEEHNRRVREKVPQDRLLEYSVKEGWEPLCNFLEIAECPQTPFPKTNSARSVQVQAISSFILPFSILLFVLFYGFAGSFKWLTGKTVLQWASWKRRELILTLRRIFLGEKVSLWHTHHHKKH